MRTTVLAILAALTFVAPSFATETRPNEHCSTTTKTWTTHEWHWIEVELRGKLLTHDGKPIRVHRYVAVKHWLWTTKCEWS